MSWRTASKVKWLRALPGVSEAEPLASSNSFGIGGPAEFFVEMGKPQAIEEVIEGAAERGIPYIVLGARHNLPHRRRRHRRPGRESRQSRGPYRRPPDSCRRRPEDDAARANRRRRGS